MEDNLSARINLLQVGYPILKGPTGRVERERIYESEPSGSLELCHGGGAAADRLRQNERRVG